MDIYPPLNYCFPYGGCAREDISLTPPENQSISQLVYVRRMGDFRKPVSCKRLESLRDGVRDYLYLSLLDNLIKKSREQGKEELAVQGEKRLAEIVLMHKKNEEDFNKAKEALAEEILRFLSQVK